MKEIDAWNKAARIAHIAMGKERGGRKKDRRWIAEIDPLAWVCLTELIMTMRYPSKGTDYD